MPIFVWAMLYTAASITFFPEVICLPCEDYSKWMINKNLLAATTNFIESTYTSSDFEEPFF